MDIEYEYSTEHDVLIATVKGTYIISDDVSIVEQIVARLKVHHCTKTLFDYRDAEFVVEVLPAYDRPKVLESLGIDQSFRFASVYNFLDEDTRYTETVYRNRGWRMKDFTDFDEAIHWLTKP